MRTEHKRRLDRLERRAIPTPLVAAFVRDDSTLTTSSGTEYSRIDALRAELPRGAIVPEFHIAEAGL